MKLTAERVEELAQLAYDKRVKRAGPQAVGLPWDLTGDGFRNDMRDAVRFIDCLFETGNFVGPIDALERIKSACWFEADEHFVDEVFTELVPVTSVGNAIRESCCFCHHRGASYTEDDFAHQGFKDAFKALNA